MDIAEFLLARIAEDADAAQAAVARNGATWSTTDLSDGVRVTGTTEFGNPRSYRADAELWDDEGAIGMFAETAAHVVRHDPARVLADCEAKRRIVEHETDEELVGIGEPEGRTVLRLLALPYADHPNYRPEWSPLTVV